MVYVYKFKTVLIILISQEDIMSLTRKEKVYQELKKLSDTILDIDFCSNVRIGFDASFIGERINISRNNVSKELNLLLKEGKVVKFLGKPILYIDKKTLEGKLHQSIKISIFDDINSLRNTVDKVITPKDSIAFKEVYAEHKENKNSDILESMIGAKDSLKTLIKQAKAAILYPPNGLHTLLVGDTGVGKTTFAEIIYRYAVDIGKLSKDSPFVIFNCADYSENPQLLMSHLFGHVKGAFTGANSEKKGLVDQANNGILFLDEIHRLPPEGQEMLFLIIDKGIYRRLGESDNVRKSNFMMIGATTEDPKLVMLSTFLRRIPVVIKLPNLDERTLKERMTLICHFFRKESEKIKLPIKVMKEVLRVFLLYNCPGNIGQLKNDIQLICANAFVDYLSNNLVPIEIKLSHLSQSVKDGFFKIDDRRKEIAKSFNLNDSQSITFDGVSSDLKDDLKDLILYDNYDIEKDYYNVIINNYDEFSKEGLTNSQIRMKILNQIREYFDKTPSEEKVKNAVIDQDAVLKVVTSEIFNLIEGILNEANGTFNKSYERKVVYSLALHIEILIERLKMGMVTIHPNKETIFQQHHDEYIMAQSIKIAIEKNMSIKVPDDEIAFIVMFLYAVSIERDMDNIGVLVIAHGYKTATNMVQVANTLLGVDYAYALDMPLEEEVQTVLNNAVDIVKRIDRGRGVLLLVDMGSLTTFSEIITERTGIETRIIKMVSTPMIIEATRRAMMPNLDLDTLVESVKKMSSFIGNRIDTNDIEIENNNKKVINRKTLVDILDQTLVFLNPNKTYDLLKETLENILRDCNASIDDEIKIKFLFHCSCMIERTIKNENLSYNNFMNTKVQYRILYDLIKSNFVLVEQSFGIEIPDSEYAYVVEMFNTHFDTHRDTHNYIMKSVEVKI